MEINGKVHCFFEQSGTFKNEFIKLGIPAEDYDIQNNFGETDHVVDLFDHIEREYDKTRQDKTRQDKTRQDKTRQDKTIFDDITKDDLIIAFFPCIYFENIQMLYFSLESLNNRLKTIQERIVDAIERLEKRTYFHKMLYKMYSLALDIGCGLIIENPYSELSYLTGVQNFPSPKVIDKNRMLRGDYFVKPTAYWFFNIEPQHGFTYQYDKQQKTVKACKKGKQAGLCSEERSMISKDYARNFICDFILGKRQEVGQLTFGF